MSLKNNDSYSFFTIKNFITLKLQIEMVIGMTDEYYIIADKYEDCIDYLKSLTEATSYEVVNEVEDALIKLKKISFIETDGLFKATIIIEVPNKNSIEKVIQILNKNNYTNITITKTIQVIGINGDDNEQTY